MAKTLVAYTAALTSTSTFTKLAPATDQHVTVDGTGKTIQVPYTNSVVGAYAYGASFLLAQIQTPSLKANRVPIEIGEVDTTASNPINTEGAIPPFQYLGDSPIPLSQGEPLEFDYTGGGTTVGAGGIWLADGRTQQVTGPLLHGVRATSSTTMVAFTWGATSLTFDNQLPVGDYAVVGMQAFGVSMVFARLILPGCPWRMGVIGGPITVSTRDRLFRDGRFMNQASNYPGASGTYEAWGGFRSTSPPQIEAMAVTTDSAQVYYLDLVKIDSATLLRINQ